jgi:hypothetical protein
MRRDRRGREAGGDWAGSAERAAAAGGGRHLHPPRAWRSADRPGGGPLVPAPQPAAQGQRSLHRQLLGLRPSTHLPGKFRDCSRRLQ